MEEKSFPLSFYPKPLQEILLEVAATYSYPIDYVCSSVLSACATSIGNSNAIHVKDNWIENPSLFIALIGAPGVNKSAPLEWAMAPLQKKEKELHKQYRKECKEFDELPEKDKKTEPILKKTITSDATIEALIHHLNINDRGILIYIDELAGFLNTFQRYSKGNDEQQYLSAWSGKSISVDRKTSRSLRVDKPILNIIGTIQPVVLEKSFIGKEDSGFFDRWLLCYPKAAKKEYWSDFELDRQLQYKYDQIIDSLLYLSPTIDQWENITPQRIIYSKEGMCVLKAWQKGNTDEINNSHDDIHKGIRAKIETYVHRFALITELIEWAVYNPIIKPMEISSDSVKRAIDLCEYFTLQAINVRTGDPVENLPDAFKELTDTLNVMQEFTYAEFIERCIFLEIPEGSARKWLKKNTGNNKIFMKVKHGVYARA